MTIAARAALEEAEVVVGYRSYVEAVRPLLDGKETRESGMQHERERVMQAVELAEQGRLVALISGGDPGVYGMAGAVLEMLPPHTALEMRIVPGVTAASAAAACLGAPLMNDFAVISLSDLLTPLETIEQRLKGAIAGDFVIALYNPRSRRRLEPLKRALRLLRAARSPDTIVGIVRDATRPTQTVSITTLEALNEDDLDMSTVVIVGNTDTTVIGDRMVTKRGYKLPRDDSQRITGVCSRRPRSPYGAASSRPNSQEEE